MTLTIIALIVQLLVAGLLVATIVYAFILNRKLTSLRGDQSQFEQLIVQFTSALGLADNGVQNLRNAALEAGGSLQKFIDRAQILRDELAYMLESGDTLAGNLADRIQVTRQSSQKAAKDAAKDAARDADASGALTDAEKLAAQIVAATDDAMPETEKSREKTIMKALRGLR
jgi:hypothetical protein